MGEYPAEVDGDKVIATVEMDSDATARDENKIIHRLDDGNDFPGLQVERADDVLYVLRG